MSKTNYYLDSCLAKTGAPSDYALAKILGITRSGLSKYRNNKTQMDDSVCLKVASILEIEPMIVISAMHAERARSEKEKAVWTALFEKLGGMAASVLIATTIFSTPAPVKASEQATSYNNVYYVKSRRRKRKPFNPLRMMVEQLLATA